MIQEYSQLMKLNKLIKTGAHYDNGLDKPVQSL